LISIGKTGRLRRFKREACSPLRSGELKNKAAGARCPRKPLVAHVGKSSRSMATALVDEWGAEARRRSVARFKG
jgi:hypothetical protein